MCCRPETRVINVWQLFAVTGANNLASFDGQNGASEGIRTLDVHLGKVMLYQTELRSRYQPTDGG